MFNRVAFVTGASRGIGREIALTLCRAGFDIAVASPEIEKNEEVAEKIRACSGQALTVNLNLLSYDSIREGFAKALQQFGRIDVLVNNAGVTRDGLAVRMKREDWDRVLQINLHGAFFAIQQVLPTMMKQRYGRIVNIASIAGKDGNPNASHYSASKAGLIGLTKSLAKELATKGVLVNCVTPAAAKTELFAQMKQEHIDYMLAKIPMNRFLEVEELAAMVAWLSSEDCSFSTGAVFDISGGRGVY